MGELNDYKNKFVASIILEYLGRSVNPWFKGTQGMSMNFPWPAPTRAVVTITNFNHKLSHPKPNRPFNHHWSRQIGVLKNPTHPTTVQSDRFWAVSPSGSGRTESESWNLKELRANATLVKLKPNNLTHPFFLASSSLHESNGHCLPVMALSGLKVL